VNGEVYLDQCRPAPTNPSGGRVLSIQSHTVHGYVGNKSAVFPLQLLGFDVDPVNSVQFSNHTGYGEFAGQVLGGSELDTLIDGLGNIGAYPLYTHMLTGYIGSTTFLKAVLNTISKIRKVNPDLIYLCDPVLGDNGKLYVPEDLVRVYREEVLCCATILTPNQFECELLTGIKINCRSDALKACRSLHSKGVAVVLLTSLDLDKGTGNSLVLMVSKDTSNGKEAFELSVPKLNGYFTGTGDLIASNFLAWYYRYPDNIPLALELAASTVQGVLVNTIEYAKEHPPSSLVGKGRGNPPPELRLVQSKRQIEAPKIIARAKRIDLASTSS
jgi:pyridoxine kinase